MDAILGRAGDALDSAYEELLAHVRGAAAVNVDETGWRPKGARRTLWGALSSRAAIFRIAPDRHEREAAALLGEDFGGVVGSDRRWAYRGFDPGRRRLCWSHLIRDFTAHAEGLAAQKEFGERGLDIARRLFRAREQFQLDGDRRRLKRSVAPLRRELEALPRQGSRGKRHKLVRGFSNNLLKLWPALRTFTEIDGVEPPTTEPSARCAGRSSTASSRPAASQSKANARSSGSSPRRSPAGCSGPRSSPTPPMRSAPGPAATQSRRSPKRQNRGTERLPVLKLPLLIQVVAWGNHAQFR